MRPFTEPSPPQGTVCNALIGVDLYLREGDFRPSQTAMDDLRRWWVAERVGFEPTVALQRHAISSRAQSATLASLPGGEGGIRTHDEIAPIPVFETGALNRSATSPQTLDYSTRRARPIAMTHATASASVVTGAPCRSTIRIMAARLDIALTSHTLATTTSKLRTRLDRGEQ